MPEWTRIIAGDRSLTVVKDNHTFRRDLEVRITAYGAARGALRIDFPADQDVLEINDLADSLVVDVRVRRRRLWHRLRHPETRRRLHLEALPLRLLVTGSGRCGTQTIARYLDGLRFTDGEPVIAHHEPLSAHVVPALIERRYDFVHRVQMGLGHNVEAAPYYALYPQAIAAHRVVHLIRDGRAVVQSGLNRGWYQNDSPWNRLKPGFAGDAFARSCHLWRLACEQAASVAIFTVRLEDLTTDPQALASFCDRLDIAPDNRALPHANQGKQPASWASWTPEQHHTFEAIAGAVMDRFYPHWRGRSLAAEAS